MNRSAGTEDFWDGFVFGEFVDEFVEIANLLDEGIGELFDTVAANGAGDEGGIGVELSLVKKVFQDRFFLDEGLQLFGIEASEP